MFFRSWSFPLASHRGFVPEECVESRYHICLFCGSRILCDKVIKAHIMELYPIFSSQTLGEPEGVRGILHAQLYETNNNFEFQKYIRNHAWGHGMQNAQEYSQVAKEKKAELFDTG